MDNRRLHDKPDNTKKNRPVAEVAMCGLFVAVALIFSYVENLLPIPFPVPGMRLGFANIAILTVLYMYGAKDAFFVNVIRIVLAALLFGNLQSFFFSMAGGMASLGIMTLLKRIDRFSLIGVSAAGGITHNIAQIIIAIWILSTPAIGYLLPIFIVLGVATGIMCGIVARLFLKHVAHMT